MKDKNLQIVNICASIFMLLAVAFTFFFSVFRSFFGVELSDEAYSVAELYLVSQGAVPFVDNWSQMPGYALLLAPFIKLYVLISGGTEGIVLFYRMLCNVLIVVTMAAIYVIANRYVKEKIICLAYVLPFFAIKGGGRIFRGDQLTILMIGIAGFMFVASFCDESREKNYSVFSGFLMALSVMVYPSLIVTYFFMVIAGIIYELKMKKRVPNLLRFIGGSVLAAVICIGYLVLKSSIFDVLNGIRLLLKDVMYWQLGTDTASSVKVYILVIIRHVKYLSVIIACAFGVIWGLKFIKLRKRPKIEKKILVLSIVVGIVLDVIFHVYLRRESGASAITTDVTTIFLIATPILLPFIKTNRKMCNLLFIFVWVAEEVCKFLMGLTAHGGLYPRNSYLQNAAYLAILFGALAVKDTFLSDQEKTLRTNPLMSLVKMTPIILSGVLCMAFMYSAYAYVYRDGQFDSLTAEVTSGPYKGLYTTPERKSGIIQLEEYVRQYTSEEDTILVLDNCPFIYLMSEAKPCTPSTWDMALYPTFDYPELYYDYFKVSKQEPLKIIYANYGRDDVLSIDTNYKFNSYVNEYYDLAYENRNLFEWDYCGRQIICELLVYERK